MIYTLEPQNKVNLKATGIDRILQNGRNILSVVIGEVILARGIGINGDIVDSPLNRSTALMNMQTQFKKYEPRLKIHKVTYITDHQRGTLKPIMEVSIIE
ncbi:hypothetical protein [Psychrilyobacter atlanticus]|uniref:hypothetical protein n=1 Tax=Psychrilyobacter atlanticus TaxID=271091 RepID=UPI0004030FFB|nr:hypothetical protein [Psychrilyobacter atlanticus]